MAGRKTVQFAPPPSDGAERYQAPFDVSMEESREILLGICSDTHGEALPLWNGAKLDAVLHAGDVYDAPTLIEDDNDPIPRQSVESVGVPVLAVRGNHDFRDPARFFQAADDLSGQLRMLLPGLWIAGIGFAPERHYDLPGESDLESQCRNLSRRARREVTQGEKLILLTHYPPKLPELPCDEVPENWTYRCVPNSSTSCSRSPWCRAMSMNGLAGSGGGRKC